MFTVKIMRKDGSAILASYPRFEFVSAESELFQKVIDVTPMVQLSPYISETVKHPDKDTFDVYGFVVDDSMLLEGRSGIEPLGFEDDLYVTDETGKTVFSVTAQKANIEVVETGSM